MRHALILALAVLSLSGCSLWRSLQSAMGNQNAKSCQLLTELVDMRNDLVTVDYSQVINPDVKKLLDSLKVFMAEQKVDTAKAQACGGVAPK